MIGLEPDLPARPVPVGGACAWCGGPLDDRSERLTGRVRCGVCGVATTHPWPTEAELEAAYRGWYRPASGRFAGLGDLLLKRSRGSLARRLDRLAPPGRVLDVGAGDGALLDALRSVGRDALGTERKSSRQDVVDATLEALEPGWAAVVFWHSLEHLRRPGEALRQAVLLLRSGGVLVVAMPNAGSLQAAAFGDRWFALDLPRHLVHVPAETLLRSLAEAGARITRVSYLRGGQVVFGWLHGIVGSLPGRPDLYDAIRRPEARRHALSARRRATVLAAAVLLLPLALLCTAVELALRRGGTVYVEARSA